jgi:hypothetical protein
MIRLPQPRVLFPLALLVAPSLVHGQYYYRPGYAPRPYGYPYGGYGNSYYVQSPLSGQAEVINATGNYIQATEKARIEREQANQAKIDTKRKTFDEMMYEKANRPSYAEEQEQNKYLLIRRVMAQPTDVEIKTGKAQNILLPYLQDLNSHGVQGPSVPLDQEQLKLVNVKPGLSDSVDVGVLRTGGKVFWPVALLGSDQKKMDELLPQAVQQTIKGRVDPTTYKTIRTTIKKMQDGLGPRLFVKEEIDSGEYLEAKHFLEALDKAVASLTNPAARRFLDGSLCAEGRTVPELVEDMTSKGLTFAPCNPGDESAYLALHNAMVAYANGAQSTIGLRVPVAPPSKIDSFKRQ